MARTTRQRVLETAAAAFLEHGYAATTIRMIAARAEVSVGTVMAVGDKSALLVGTFDRAIAQVHQARLREPLSGVINTSDGQERVEQILALFEPFLTAFSEHDSLAREYAAVLVSGRHESLIFTRLAQMLQQEVAGVLVRSGTTETNAAELASAIHLAYIGTLFLWASSGSNDHAPFTNSLRAAITHLVETTEDSP